MLKDIFRFQPSLFRPYISPFDEYPFSHASPISFSEHLLLANTDQRHSSQIDTYNNALTAQLRSWLLKHRQIDISSRYCQYEAAGTCNDDGCQSIHAASFAPTGKSFKLVTPACVRRWPLTVLIPVEYDIPRFINDVYSLPPNAKAQRQEVFQKGMNLIMMRNGFFGDTSSTVATPVISRNVPRIPEDRVCKVLSEAAQFYQAALVKPSHI